jgi:pyruvate ferredoxin oxidoreductase alpha subunit
LNCIPQLAEQFKTIFGRDSGGLTHSYLTEDAETIVVAMGSVLGTIKDVVDEMRAAGEKIGVLGITSYRPFPIDSVRAALQNAQRVVVLEKSLAVGIGGVVSTDVRMAMSGLQLRWTHRRRRTRRTGDHHESPACAVFQGSARRIGAT